MIIQICDFTKTFDSLYSDILSSVNKRKLKTIVNNKGLKRLNRENKRRFFFLTLSLTLIEYTRKRINKKNYK